MQHIVFYTRFSMPLVFLYFLGLVQFISFFLIQDLLSTSIMLSSYFLTFQLFLECLLCFSTDTILNTLSN